MGFRQYLFDPGNPRADTDNPQPTFMTDEKVYLNSNLICDGEMIRLGSPGIRSRIPKHLHSHILPSAKVESLLASAQATPQTNYRNDPALEQAADAVLEAKRRGEQSSSEAFDEMFIEAQTRPTDRYGR